MAVYKLFPTKDATIYSQSGSMNTGLDEILAASTYVSESKGQVTRYLLKFSDDDIRGIIGENGIAVSKSFQCNLVNYAAVVTGLNLTNRLYVYAVSGAWDMGTGKLYNSPQTTNGVSWVWQTYSGSTQWALDPNYNIYATGSYVTNLEGGGTWYTGSNISTDNNLNISESYQLFSYSNPIDLNIDVTNIVNTWYSYSLDDTKGFPNDGLIVKQQNSSEFLNDLNKQATFKYFSIDTHTIYPPHLDFKFDDYVFSTGSSTNTILETPTALISVYNNVGTYYSQSIAKFRVAAAPKYPDRVFQTSSYYTTNYYLPPEISLYAIKDTDTNEFVVNFDDTFTRISADNESSYFDIYMNGLEPERMYTILLKTTIGGATKVFDEDIMFKVAKG
tara:strand:- start:2342 stop:3505 length:1164 start_codon:yes stop_codon:yes gene_type:complete